MNTGFALFVLEHKLNDKREKADKRWSAGQGEQNATVSQTVIPWARNTAKLRRVNDFAVLLVPTGALAVTMHNLNAHHHYKS